MIKNKTSFLAKLKSPSLSIKIISFITTALSVIGSIAVLLIDYENGLLEVAVYCLFALSALSLCYSVYIIVILAPSIKKNFLSFLERHSFTYLLLKNYGFRTVVFAIGSFISSILFGGLSAYLGIANRSIWYGALAGYYIALAFLRGGILIHHTKRIGKGGALDAQKEGVIKAKVYRNCGIILLLLNVALSTAIAQMIFRDAHFEYVGLAIFAYAAYAFYKITMSIINVIKVQKQKDLTVRAIRNVNLADATVSILALQTALLTTFNSGEISVSLMNTITGIAVSAFCIGLGAYMIVSATKRINKLTEK